MQTCDCCYQYEYRASMAHNVECEAKTGETAFHRLPTPSNKSIIRENQKPPNLFSIDAILSRPLKPEKMKRATEDDRISPCYHRVKESISPVSYRLCCSSPKSRFSECQSPLCQSPNRASPPHRSECMAFYRRSEFPRPLKEFHLERRIVHEPTMVPLDKQGYTTGCANCQECKIAELRRLRFGPSSMIPCNSDAVTASNHLEHGHDQKRSKRKRTIFTTEQLDRLEHEFQHQQYVVGQERKYLAVELGLNEIQVKVWFQNRRIKWRKQKGSRMQPVSLDMENF